MPAKRDGYTAITLTLPDELAEWVRTGAFLGGEKVNQFLCRIISKAAKIKVNPVPLGRPFKNNPEDSSALA